MKNKMIAIGFKLQYSNTYCLIRNHLKKESRMLAMITTDDW